MGCRLPEKMVWQCCVSCTPCGFGFCCCCCCSLYPFLTDCPKICVLIALYSCKRRNNKRIKNGAWDFNSSGELDRISIATKTETALLENDPVRTTQISLSNLLTVRSRSCILRCCCGRRKFCNYLGDRIHKGNKSPPLHNREMKSFTRWNAPTSLGEPYLWDERSRQNTEPTLHTKAFGAAKTSAASVRRAWKMRFRTRDPSWSQCPWAWHLESGTFRKRLLGR